MTTTIDFKGWWCVRDVSNDTEHYAVCEVVGHYLSGGQVAVMQIGIRYPDTGEVLFGSPMGEDLFLPADRALAEAHAAKLNAAVAKQPKAEDAAEDAAA
jgi:hypothetical protein